MAAELVGDSSALRSSMVAFDVLLGISNRLHAQPALASWALNPDDAQDLTARLRGDVALRADAAKAAKAAKAAGLLSGRGSAGGVSAALGGAATNS